MTATLWTDYLPRYTALISSPAQLVTLKQATTPAQLLAMLKRLWQCEQLSDDVLLSLIHQLNQQPLDSAALQLAGHWLPWQYLPATGHPASQAGAQTEVAVPTDVAAAGRVRWLLPVGHPTQPFLADYLSDCRQQLLLNQIIIPCCSQAVLLAQAKPLPRCQPALFIGHLSRCGSTLLAGVLAEADDSLVLSEPPLLTDILLDAQFEPALQHQLLSACVDLQAAAFPTRPALVIKWNAWDLLHWSKISACYPAVRTLFVMREPLEILASQQKSAGRHMSGDPTLGVLHPVFNAHLPDDSLLARQIAVLRVLLEALLQLMRQPSLWQPSLWQQAPGRHGAVLLDYQQLQEANLLALTEQLGFTLTDVVRVRQRLQFDAKAPDRRFSADSAAKRQQFSAPERALIQQQLSGLYQQLAQQQADFPIRQEQQYVG